MSYNKKEKVRIIPLGGVEQIGANCTLIEYENQIVIIDVGLGFPSSQILGIDYFIPNLDYLKKNKHKIEGVVITHGHLDHIGGLSHFIEALDFPEVYASRFALELIKVKLKEKKLLDKARLREVSPDSKLQSKAITIEFFRVNHSIPESMGVLVRTPAGNIVHTGDFKFDNSPVNEPVADYGKLAKIGNEGVLALLSDSTNSFKAGHSTSETEVAEILENVCEDAKGRIIVATFSSLVTRLYQLIQIAQKLNRKIYISGRSMETAIKIAKQIGYINASSDLFINPKSVKRYKEDRVMVLATGAQGESMAALARMGRGEHKDIKIQKGDTIILSASVIPGNDLEVQTMIDALSKKGAIVFHKDIMDLHSSGHGFKEDQKLMINLVRPKYFIPIHGYQSFLFEHGRTAQELGIKKQHVILSENGDIIEIDRSSWDKVGRIKATPLLVSGLGVGDIGASVLSDREQLANYGIVFVVMVVDKKTKKLLNRPDIISRGFVYVKHNFDLIDSISDKVQAIYNQEITKASDLKSVKQKIQAEIRRLLYKETEREPMILVSFQEIGV